MTGTEPCTAQSKSFQETWKKEKLDEDQLHGLVLDVALERRLVFAMDPSRLPANGLI